MKNSVIRTIAVASLSVGSLLAMTACGGVKAAVYEPGNPVKVGLICLHDSNSTYDANFINALDEAVKALGSKVEFDKSCLLTGVNEDQACFNAAKDLVKKGCNVIFADSFGHQSYMLEAAKKWPEVQFCHATGTNAKTANQANYHNAFASIYQGRFMAGYAAGLKLIIDNQSAMQAGDNLKVGYVGAYPYAEVKSGYTSWFLGLRAAVKDGTGDMYDSSKITMDVQFTNSWYDPDAEAAAATRLIEGGAVLISQHADSMGAPGVCESKKVPNVTYNIETKEQCPNTYLAYSRINWAPYYQAVVNAVYAGKAIEGEKNANWTGTLATDSVQYNVNWDNLTKDAATLEVCKEMFDAVAKDIKSGARKVFDTSTFTVKGAAVTTYQADTDGDFAGDTEAIKTENGVSFFDESTHCSAPYFDLDIDGINIAA